MAEKQEPTPVSGMHGVHLAALFLLTAPVMGWAAGAAWAFFAMGVLFNPIIGPLALAAVLVSLVLGFLPVVWVVGLLAAWRDLGRDKHWFVRYSPWALAGVFIWIAIATATDRFQGS